MWTFAKDERGKYLILIRFSDAGLWEPIWANDQAEIDEKVKSFSRLNVETQVYLAYPMHESK